MPHTRFLSSAASVRDQCASEKGDLALRVLYGGLVKVFNIQNFMSIPPMPRRLD